MSIPQRLKTLVSRHVRAHAFAHCDSRRDCVDADLVPGVTRGYGSGQRGNATLCHGVAVSIRDGHQGSHRSQVDNGPSAGPLQLGNAVATDEEGTEHVQPYHSPELVNLRLGDAAVMRGGATGDIAKNIDRAEMLPGTGDRGEYFVAVPDVTSNREGSVVAP